MTNWSGKSWNYIRNVIPDKTCSWQSMNLCRSLVVSRHTASIRIQWKIIAEHNCIWASIIRVSIHLRRANGFSIFDGPKCINWITRGKCSLLISVISIEKVEKRLVHCIFKECKLRMYFYQNNEFQIFLIRWKAQKKHTVGFKCPTGANCRYVWRCAIEQMLFFTWVYAFIPVRPIHSIIVLILRLPNSQNASIMSGGGFMRGTKFRYTGRTEREILTESLNALRQQHLLNNTSPSKRKANSVPATPSSPQGDMADIREWNTKKKRNCEWMTIRNYLQVIVVCRAQQCPSRWVAPTTIAKKVPFHVWKLSPKRLDVTLVCQSKFVIIEITYLKNLTFHSRFGWQWFIRLLFPRLIWAFIIGKWIHK